MKLNDQIIQITTGGNDGQYLYALTNGGDIWQRTCGKWHRINLPDEPAPSHKEEKKEPLF